jgi:hypothetical protein
MKRQLLAGRFGPDDHIEIPAAADEQLTLLQMVAGEKSLDHGIGSALTSLHFFGRRARSQASRSAWLARYS